MKLEDTFAEHPKVELAGEDAAWLYVSGLLYAYRADTDGFVPAAKVPKLTAKRSPLKLAARLVDVKLWTPVEGGFRIHDYLDHQQSSSERSQQREANAERLRKHRQKKRKGNADVAGDVTPLQNHLQRDCNADVTTPEGEGENYTASSVGGHSTPLGSSNVVDFANVDDATKAAA